MYGERRTGEENVPCKAKWWDADKQDYIIRNLVLCAGGRNPRRLHPRSGDGI